MKTMEIVMDLIERLNALRDDPNLTGKYLIQIFPQSFLDRHPYHNVGHGCCIQCGREMYPNERNPPGKTPRAICHDCYSTWTSQVTEMCPICGEDLSDDKVKAQSINPKDISHRICDGSCTDYFTIISCKALFEDLYFLRDPYDMVKKGLRDRLDVVEHEIYNNIGDMNALSIERTKLLFRYGSIELFFDEKDKQLEERLALTQQDRIKGYFLP